MNDEAAQQFLQLEAQVKQKFTREALLRYGTLKQAHPQKAFATIMGAAEILKAGQATQIDDELLKKILIMFQGRKTMNIQRK